MLYVVVVFGIENGGSQLPTNPHSFVNFLAYPPSANTLLFIVPFIIFLFCVINMSKGFSLFNQKLREKIGVVSSEEITKNNEVDEFTRKTELMVHHLSKLTSEFAKSFKSSQSNRLFQNKIFGFSFVFLNVLFVVHNFLQSTNT
jgi:hypothetical protein